MSVQTEIERLKSAVGAAYTAAEAKGAELPTAQTAANLAATIETIQAATQAADYVTEQGVSGKWTYRKWNSGIAECWGVFSASGAVQTTTAWGSIYYGTWMDTTENKNGRKYPVAFTEEPVVTATPIGVSGDFWLMTNATNNTGTLKTHAPAYSIARPDQWGATNPRISYHVVGRWK